MGKNTINEQIELRKNKSLEYKEKNKPSSLIFKPDTYISVIKEKYQQLDKEMLEKEKYKKNKFKLAGRIILKRIMGKASFITLKDFSGEIQLYLRKDDLPSEQFNYFKLYYDLGDIIGTEGYIFKTNTGELSLYVLNIKLLVKSIRPFPEKFHGLQDTETRYRKRYIDLITNQESFNVFKVRSKIITFIRNYFNKEDFIEVETPMMHTIPGGAIAKPFLTHHNALNIPLYLRIAPELYLKRLIVGGFDKVYEINRNFRNEGLSTRHNPEFTMIEFYQTYSNYNDLIKLTEKLIQSISSEVLGNTKINYQNSTIDLSLPFNIMTMLESIDKFNSDITINQLNDMSITRNYAEKIGVKIEEHYGLGKIQTEIFEKTVEHKLIKPTFITDYPTEVSPLAKRKEGNDLVTERFEFFIGGYEIANGFSELNDPVDQLNRFKKQKNTKEIIDNNLATLDHDYIEALEYGMPPTAGEGIGIDRLVMLLTNSESIKDVILFPQMKPKD